MSRWLSKVNRLNRRPQPVHAIVDETREEMKRLGMFVKDPKGTTTLEHRKTSRGRKATENTNKDKVRHRDHRRCRFPQCGCRRRGWRLEVSHDRHKGIGGNPKGDRSETPGLILMCLPRHQTSRFSRHAMTIRNVYLTDAGNDGPIAWQIKRSELVAALEERLERERDARAREMLQGLKLLGLGDEWLELARESRIQQLEPLDAWQRATLDFLETVED